MHTDNSRAQAVVGSWTERRVTVGISEAMVSTDPGACLATYALGSCVAVLLHSGAQQVSGLLHFMLPDSTLNPAKAKHRPGMFADTGLSLLLGLLAAKGLRPASLVATVVGGGSLHGMGTMFPVGENNQQAARELLKAAGIRVVREDLGGNCSRSVFMLVGSGRVLVRSPSGEYEL